MHYYGRGTLHGVKIWNFCNGLTRFGDLSKEGNLQAIKDGDWRFLQVRSLVLNTLLVLASEIKLNGLTLTVLINEYS